MEDAQASFWDFLDKLVEMSPLILDRPRGSTHPRYPGYIYPLDYGYLDGTTAVDGGGVDVWVGTIQPRCATGALLTVDLYKRDTELKILLGCTSQEMQIILDFVNEGTQNGMRALVIPRPKK